MHRFDVIEDCSERFQDIGFSRAIESGKTVGIELIVALELPFTKEVNFEALGEAAKIIIEFEAQEFHLGRLEDDFLTPLVEGLDENGFALGGIEVVEEDVADGIVVRLGEYVFRLSHEIRNRNLFGLFREEAEFEIVG